MSGNSKIKKIISAAVLFFSAVFLINCAKAEISNSTQGKTNTSEVASGGKVSNLGNDNSESSNTVNSVNENSKNTDSANLNIGIIDVSLSPGEKDKNKFEIMVDSVSGWAKPKAGDEFDIMNEYGFLAKGKLANQKDGLWEAEIIPGSQRADLLKLSDTRMVEMEKESPNIPAFGVFPSNPSRTKIKTGDKVDMSEKGVEYRKTVYQSLPKEVQEFGNTDENGAKGSLEYPNSWSDIDGDGKIDFVVIRGACKDNKQQICSEKYLLNNNKWSEVIKNN